MLRRDVATTSAAAWQRRALAAEARLAALGQPPLPGNLTAVLQRNTAEDKLRLAFRGRGRKGKGGRGRKGRQDHAGKGRGGVLVLPPLPTHLDAAAHTLLDRTRREATHDPSAAVVLRGWQQHRARGVEDPLVRAAGVGSPGAANPFRAAPLPMRPCEGGGGAAGAGLFGPAPLFMAAEKLEVLAAERAPYGLQMGGKSEAEARAAIARYQRNTSQPLRCRFDSCAVVGSSGRLRGAHFGPYIDAHEAVIRINAAPTTSNHAAAVGSRTTWRVHNSEKVS